ncbi:hypothetical protein TSOC_003830 [Tetrabaena socialis]|uniref:Uncharacterized protein n=1 Tax=Tetrabaena socialis TaxID=47790 RepID=A0A2J8AAM4_9CHLO|nr:hypothetical protein TSOC_003830 [Tetrabaena socialis]|eukprot:PNH09574.1 hypothetical protein TSOC_003830 [Tetrabaena socialis]
MQVSSFQCGAAHRLARRAPAHPRSAPAVLGIAARSGLSRQLAVAVCAAKKGFGKEKPQQQQPARRGDNDSAPGGKQQSGRKGRRVQLKGDIGPIPGQRQSQPQPSQFAPQLLVPDQPAEEEGAFLERLQSLKQAGRERAAEQRAAANPSAGELDALSQPVGGSGSSSGSGRRTAAFDPRENIYDNPPPLAQTLMAAATGGVDTTSISDPKLRNANIGPNQLGLAAGALVFIACFLIVAAGDYAPASKRYSGVRSAQAPPDPIEQKILLSKVSLYEDQLKIEPNNDAAAEALGASYAKLLQYDKVADLYDKYTKRNPTATEAWRLLGESSLLSQQPRKAVPAFERAVELRRQQQPPSAANGFAVVQPDMQLLTGLVDSYVANAEFGKAVDALGSIRAQLKDSLAQRQAAAAAAATTAAAEVAATAEVAAAAEVAAVMPVAEVAAEASTTEAAAAEASSSSAPPPGMLEAPPLAGAGASTSAAAAASLAPPPPAPRVRPLDPVSVELLTAKVFSSWRGHEQDALGTYDQLIKVFPEARFFAPASMQQLVRSIADSTPVLTSAPPDN